MHWKGKKIYKNSYWKLQCDI